MPAYVATGVGLLASASLFSTSRTGRCTRRAPRGQRPPGLGDPRGPGGRGRHLGRGHVRCAAGSPGRAGALSSKGAPVQDSNLRSRLARMSRSRAVRTASFREAPPVGFEPTLPPPNRARCVVERAARTALVAPPVGFEPTLPPPEGGALSPELRGLRDGPEPYPRLVRAEETGARAPPSAPIPLAGDSRAAVRSDRRRAGDAVRRGCAHPAGRRAERGDGRAAAAARSTATTRPTSRSSWPSRPGTNPRDLAELVAGPAAQGRGHRGGRRRRARASSTSASSAGAQGAGRRAGRGRRRGVRHQRHRRGRAGRTSSSSARTRPAR